MTTAEILQDALGRIREVVHDVVGGLTPEQLSYRPGPAANSIAWLIWHLTRVQDDHVADLAATEQAWTGDGWSARFGLPFGDLETGYGQTPDEASKVAVDSGVLLTGYYDAVHAKSIAFVRRVTDADLDRIIDERWDPPVTLGVRLVSVIDDDAQHAGQAAYVKGLLLAR
jgi:uncharacterized damage-inducible protein DinB